MAEQCAQSGDELAAECFELLRKLASVSYSVYKALVVPPCTDEAHAGASGLLEVVLQAVRFPPPLLHLIPGSGVSRVRASQSDGLLYKRTASEAFY